MTNQSQLILATLCGAIALAVIELAVDDWKSWADANEKEVCKDKSPEFRAMIVRYPGEAHTVEWCAQFLKFTQVGSKEFLPELGAVLPPDKMKITR